MGHLNFLRRQITPNNALQRTPPAAPLAPLSVRTLGGTKAVVARRVPAWGRFSSHREPSALD